MAIKYYKDGTKKSEEPWADDIRVGSGIEYRENGTIAKEVEYADSVQSEVWYRRWSKWKEMRYDKDQHNGIPTYYDENGTQKEGPPMVDGKLHGMVMGYHEDGTKSMETPYVEGKRQGVMIKYHEDGSKSGEYSYVKGVQDGAQTLYHKNGSKRLESHYVKAKCTVRRFGTMRTETRWKKHPRWTAKPMVWLEGYHEDGSKSTETPYLKANAMA